MLEAGVEDVELRYTNRLDEVDELDYIDDEFLEGSERSLLQAPDESEKDPIEVGTFYLICLAISTGG